MKKKSHTKIYEVLQFFSTSFHILLSLYNIFIFMQLSLSICHCFYKNILN